jgi:Mn2+/Fe2+ NRAMP family transporter
LSGSAAYALAETFGWRQGLDESIDKARSFYAVVLLSTAIGIGIDFTNINAVSALYWSAVINGLLAPFLLVGILVVASDSKIMQGQPSSILGRVTVGIATLFMFGAGIGMFVF